MIRSRHTQLLLISFSCLLAACDRGASAPDDASRGQQSVRVAAAADLKFALDEIIAAFRAAQPAITTAQRAATAVQEGAQTAVNALREAAPGLRSTAPSVGAAATPDALRRAEIAAQLPVPLKGESGLTAGQLVRRTFSPLLRPPVTVRARHFASAARIPSPLRMLTTVRIAASLSTTTPAPSR